MRPATSSVFSFVVCATAAVATAHAQPQDNAFGPWYLDEAASGWYFDALAGIEYEPTYAGSDRRVTEPEANFRAIYKSGGGHRYFVSLGEAGAVFELSPTLLLSAVAEYEEGREDEDDATLTGFDEVEATVEAQVSLFRRFGRYNVAAVFQPDVLGRGKGLVYFVGAGYDRTLVPGKSRFHVSFDVSWGDAEHMRTEFGVTAPEAGRTGLPAYAPDGALKSASLQLDAEYRFAPRWSVLVGSEIEYYFDEAARSPLIEREGSRTTYELFAAARYRF